MADSSAKKAMPRFAIASTDIRRDLIAPLRYFTRLEIAHLYRRAPYHDLVTEDWDANLIAYGSPTELYRLVRRLSPDVIQGVEPFSIRLLPYLYATYLAARSRSLPLIVPTLENRPLAVKHGSIFSRLLRTVLRPVFAYASLIICVNKGALRNIRSVGNYETKVQYLMYGTWGVDLDEFFPRSERQATAAKRLLFVGRLAREKGILDLLAAFGQVHDIFPDCRLTLAGDGPDRETIETTMASSSWGGSVDLLGTVKNRDIPTLIRESDVFVAPSITTRKWEEQVGMANLQAMACGVPVVSTRSGAIPEYVPNGEAGILVPEQDPEALAEAITTLLGNDELRHTMGVQGAYASVHYDAATNVRRAEDVPLARCLDL